MSKLVNCGNYFEESRFNELCKELEQGETVKVYIDSIGHSRNNYEQENYKKALLEKYGEKLKIEEFSGGYSYSYSYTLE